MRAKQIMRILAAVLCYISLVLPSRATTSPSQSPIPQLLGSHCSSKLYWRLYLQKSNNGWEAYVLKLLLYDGSTKLTTHSQTSNCERNPGVASEVVGNAFDGNGATNYVTCYNINTTYTKYVDFYTNSGCINKIQITQTGGNSNNRITGLIVGWSLSSTGPYTELWTADDLATSHYTVRTMPATVSPSSAPSSSPTMAPTTAPTAEIPPSFCGNQLYWRLYLQKNQHLVGCDHL
mmetsp:Transcript_35953/g.60812  ORF Transcript_35953/g.60812 Transcript_35953/m.60812 type:complete len:234 (-) Transcript_35953:2371-3072(-)